MTQPAFNCSLDDLICVWLDQVIPRLEELEYLSWFGEKDITIPEAARTPLFLEIRKVLRNPSTEKSPQRHILKFPTSAISRVNQAISHLSRQQVECEKHETNIVFLPTSVVQLAHQIPVARSLFENGKSYGFLFPSQKWVENISLGNLNIIAHSRYLREEMLRARLRARVLWLRLGREKNVRLPLFSLDNEQYDLSGVVLTTIAGAIHSIFESYAIAKYITKAVKPKLIVLGNDLSPYGRTIVSCVKNNATRVVSLLSLVADAPIDSYRTSDKIVVFGNYAKRTLSSWGIDNRKIKSCGSPYWDSLALPNQIQFLTNVSNNPNKKKVFVFAQLRSELEWRIKKVALASAQNFFFLCLESKRQKDRDDCSDKIRNFEVRQKQDLSNFMLATCIKSADFVLTSRFSSTIEALSVGKRVIAIDFDGEFDNQEFLKSGVVPVATDERSLLAVLEKKAENSDNMTQHMKNTMEDLFSRRDGFAAIRVARVIIEECQR